MEIAAWILGVVLLVLFLALATVVVTGVPIALAFFAAAATLKRLRQVPEASRKKEIGTKAVSAAKLLGPVLFAAFASIALGQRKELGMEEGFPLDTPIYESLGVPYCETEEAARQLVSIHVKKGLKAAREFFWKDETLCHHSIPVSLVYRRLIYSVMTAEGKRNVYEAEVLHSDNLIIFVITDWEHQRPKA